MPRFDLDDDSIYSPIEFTIDGKIYRAANTSKKDIDKIGNKSLCEQFAVLCNLDLKFVEEKMNFFQIRKAMMMFYDALMRPIITEAESLVALKERGEKLTKTETKKEKEVKVAKEKNGSGGGTKE